MPDLFLVRCKLRPELTPTYDVQPAAPGERLEGAARHLLPLGLVVILVAGVIVLGAATPTEAAAVTLAITPILLIVSMQVIARQANIENRCLVMNPFRYAGVELDVTWERVTP